MALDALYELRDARHILQNIRDYDGTNIMVSCTDDTNLEGVLKLSLCLASLTGCRAGTAFKVNHAAI